MMLLGSLLFLSEPWVLNSLFTLAGRNLNVSKFCVNSELFNLQFPGHSLLTTVGFTLMHAGFIILSTDSSGPLGRFLVFILCVASSSSDS